MSLAVIAITGLLIAVAIVIGKLNAASKKLNRVQSESDARAKRVAELEEQTRALAKYQSIVDAEAESARLVAAARREAVSTIEGAQQEAGKLREEVQLLRVHSVDEAKSMRDRAEGIVVNANAEALHIVEAANTRAQEVALASQEAKQRTISDVEKEAARLTEVARREAASLLDAAQYEAQRLKNEAQRLQARSMDEAKAMREQAEVVVSKAKTDAAQIVEAAVKRAEEIAGEALDAKQNLERLQQAAKAMKNVIEGYGDQYVIPSYSLLDDLADEFGFAEAGQKLKSSRERMRQMIKDGSAAICSYVEVNRRSTAIDFVLDAFNGKVDSILSSVRHDNYGTLERKVQDAFNLVNLNGAAFRDARITPEYLKVRLEELRWAVVANELKLKEREEQRLIKERIREEEKAQREYEKALKEAEKEEETLRKAMEKAQREIEKAGAEQKAKYEEQLRLLSEKLREAEEKNKKALSMAQQTKSGHVYVISNVGSFGEHVYKIGLTRRLEPLDRIKELGDASVPFEFDVHALIYAENAPTLEHELHKHFVKNQVNKVNPRKEFFRAPLQTIRGELEKRGINVTWTMTAEAREYKETLAIERAMQEETFKESEWLKKQLEAREPDEMREAS